MKVQTGMKIYEDKQKANPSQRYQRIENSLAQDNMNTTRSDIVMNEMQINLDKLCMSMLHRVCREIYNTNVIVRNVAP